MMSQMVIATHRLALGVVSLAFASALTGCDNSSDYIKITRLAEIKGQFLISRTGTAIPLSDDESRVEYQYGSDRETLFIGEGGPDPVVMVDRTKALLIIAACNNRRVNMITAAFDETPSTTMQGQRYRVQLINNAGFSYHGKPLCVPSTPKS